MKKTKLQSRLAVLLTIVLCCVLFQATVFGSETENKAAADDSNKTAETTEISTADDLLAILTEADSDKTADKSYVLSKDITLDTSKFEGSSKRKFAGSLDGKGHTVTVKKAEKNAAPLFGTLDGSAKNPAKVTNLKLVFDGDVSGTTVAETTGSAEITDLTVIVFGDILSSGKGSAAYATGIFGTHSGKAAVSVKSVTVTYHDTDLDVAELAAGVYSKADKKDGTVVLKKVSIESTVEAEAVSEPAEETQTSAGEDKTSKTEENVTTAAAEDSSAAAAEPEKEEIATTAAEPAKEEEETVKLADDPEPVQHTVTFELNGHGTAIDPVQVEDGQKAAKPEAPTETGYVFDDWYTDADFGTAYDFETAVTEDLTLYAKWTAESYTVTFYDEDGTTVLKASPYEYGTKAADIVKPETPKKEADARYTYSFDKWSPEIADVTADASYTASYKKTTNRYKVTFVDENGKELLAAKSYPYGTTAKEIKTPKKPTKSKTAQYTYTFAGWSPALSEVTQDVTYKATFTPKIRTYKVTFDANGHGTAPATQMVQYNGIVSRPANLIAVNYVFGGWYTDKACTKIYNFATPVTGKLKLYAKWTASQATTRATATTRSTTQPRTGDEANLTLWIILLVAAVVAGGCAVIFGRRSGRKNG